VEIDPCYIFHPMNAYDDGDEVVLDAIRHPRMFDRERRGPSEGDPLLARWRLDPRSGRSSQTVIDDRPQEFPRLNESLIGKPYRYGYCAGVGTGFAQDTLTKVDHATGTTVARSDQPRFGYGEPVFVPRSGAVAEDDGWLVALRHDTEHDTSDLAIFDATAITDEPVAVVHLPVRVPNGFHGNWIPDAS
jgi:carotenoid cleavage dioxygenase